MLIAKCYSASNLAQELWGVELVLVPVGVKEFDCNWLVRGRIPGLYNNPNGARANYPLNAVLASEMLADGNGAGGLGQELGRRWLECCYQGEKGASSMNGFYKQDGFILRIPWESIRTQFFFLFEEVEVRRRLLRFVFRFFDLFFNLLERVEFLRLAFEVKFLSWLWALALFLDFLAFDAAALDVDFAGGSAFEFDSSPSAFLSTSLPARNSAALMVRSGTSEMAACSALASCGGGAACGASAALAICVESAREAGKNCQTARNNNSARPKPPATSESGLLRAGVFDADAFAGALGRATAATGANGACGCGTGLRGTTALGS